MGAGAHLHRTPGPCVSGLARKLLGGFVQSNASLTQHVLEVTNLKRLHSLVQRKWAQAIAKGGIWPSNCNAVPSGS